MLTLGSLALFGGGVALGLFLPKLVDWLRPASKQ